MTVAAEVEVAVGRKVGEHLIAWCVDRFAQVLYAAQSGRSDASPDVETALSPGMSDEIEPFAIRRWLDGQNN